MPCSLISRTLSRNPGRRSCKLENSTWCSNEKNEQNVEEKKEEKTYEKSLGDDKWPSWTKVMNMNIGDIVLCSSARNKSLWDDKQGVVLALLTNDAKVISSIKP